jgi:hypothetical protein
MDDAALRARVEAIFAGAIREEFVCERPGGGRTTVHTVDWKAAAGGVAALFAPVVAAAEVARRVLDDEWPEDGVHGHAFRLLDAALAPLAPDGAGPAPRARREANTPLTPAVAEAILRLIDAGVLAGLNPPHAGSPLPPAGTG